jgi:Nuclease-related domain
MSDLATQLMLAAAVLLAALVGPFLALGILLLRKRRVRVQRKSPIGFDLLRAPGHSLLEKIDEATESVTYDVVTLMVVPSVILSLFLAQAHLRGMPAMLNLAPLYVAGVVAVASWIVRKLLKSGATLDNLKAGYDAEVAVGQELDQLMRQGAVVFHDLPAEGFNVDHVVVSRRGIFAVETKGFTKVDSSRSKTNHVVVFNGTSLAFPTWQTSEPLEQAERQAQWLSKWMSSATGESIRATPVLALPGWYVERKARGPVRIFSGRELSGLLESRGIEPLQESTMQRVVHQLDQKCRTVAPKYTDS